MRLHRFTGWAIRLSCPWWRRCRPHRDLVQVAPAESVSLQMKRLTGISDFLLLQWPSLDDGSPRAQMLELTMSPEWDAVPLYAKTLSGYRFQILLASEPTNPVPDSALTPKDAAMISTFETSFSQMDAEVAAGNANSSSILSFGGGSGLRGFYRVMTWFWSDSRVVFLHLLDIG